MWLFVAGFFLFLFGPLITMALTAFNSSQFPRVTPWECFSIEWFEVLMQDKRLMQGIRTSFVIGLGVVCVAVPLGLAGALLLTQVPDRARPWYYTILISPILVPGVVLGISTLIFWDRMGQMLFGDSVFYNGYFLTILGQSTFISAYTMLIFIARLQRFDPALEEAALDLGASHIQTFRRVLLPFLKPAIGSAAILAFLASFENYNTTVFTVVSEATLTTVLVSKVRYGINPSISALAVVIILITLFGACYYELMKRREGRAKKNEQRVAAGGARVAQRRFAAEPAAWLILAVFLAGLGTAFFAGTQGVDECKVEVKERKRAQTAARIRALNERRAQQEADEGSKTTSPDTPKSRARGTENFNNIFEKKNLEGQIDSSEAEDDKARQGTENFNSIFQKDNLSGDEPAPIGENESGESGSEPRKGTENFNNIFQKDNLSGDDPANEDQDQATEAESTPRKGTENFNNLFDPGNLKNSK